MTVPTSYYFRFWATNTILGLSFCAFLCIFPSLALFALTYPYSLVFVLSIFVIHQIYITRSFLKPYRGNFEYFYLEKRLAKSLNARILRNYGWLKLFCLWIDEFGYIGWIRDEFYKELLENETLMKDNDFRFALHLRMAKELAKGDDIQKEKEHLKEALKMRPGNPVALFRLAYSYEKAGEMEKAINSYRSLLETKLADASNFKRLIGQQIERVNTKGPRRRPPNPGLKYAVMY